MTERSTGRVRTRAALAEDLPRDHARVAFAVVDLFGNELDHHAELIAQPGGAVTGFLTRGEGPAFSERVRVAFSELGLGRAAYEHYAALAAWFEHLRGFVKLEWHRTPSGIAPRAACYFRRRPALATALARLSELGVRERPLSRARELAELLEKSTVHFVSAAFELGRPLTHKLYFSQLADAAARPAVAARLERVFELFAVTGAARDTWRALHDATTGIGDPTLFVSTTFTDGAPAASFKIDYADVSPVRAAAWQPGAAVEDIERLCARAGSRALSFLGVRFAPDQPVPALKYYAGVAA